MANIYDPNLEEDDDKELQLGGGSQVMSGGSAPSPAPTQSAAKSSGRFQNIQDYIQANQGSGFGEKFSQKLDENIAGANQVQDQAANAFKQRSDAGATKYDSGLVDQALGKDTSADFVKDQNNVQNFAKQRDAVYGGPTSLADDTTLYQQSYGATKKAQDTAKAAQSEGGRFALLNNYFGRPQYTQGERTLDQAIISADPVARQGIEQARENANQVQQNFEKQQGDLQNYAAQNLASTQEARTKTRGSLGLDEAGNISEFDPNQQQGAIQNQIKDLETRKAAQNEANQKQFYMLSDHLRGKSLTPEEMQGIGLAAGQKTYNLDPTQYLSQSGDANRSTIANEQDRAYLQALEQLAGNDNPNLIDYSSDIYDGKGYDFDKQKFLGDVSQREAGYNNYSSQLYPYFNADLSFLDQNISPEEKLNQLLTISKQHGSSGAYRPENMQNIGDVIRMIESGTLPQTGTVGGQNYKTVRDNALKVRDYLNSAYGDPRNTLTSSGAAVPATAPPNGEDQYGRDNPPWYVNPNLRINNRARS